jgi:hypothetical protein
VSLALGWSGRLCPLARVYKGEESSSSMSFPFFLLFLLITSRPSFKSRNIAVSRQRYPLADYIVNHHLATMSASASASHTYKAHGGDACCESCHYF